MVTATHDPQATPGHAPPVRFVPVTAGDAVRLAATARQAYLPHYASLWSDGGEGYVARSFAPSVLAAEIGAPGAACWFIDTAQGTAGFLKCVAPEPARAATLAPPAGYLYLERLYLGPGCTGAGLGTAALDFVDGVARARGLAGVWLRAMADEARVIAFYARHGYVGCGTDRLASPGVVAGRETMQRLARALAPP